MKKTMVFLTVLAVAILSIRCPKQDVEADKSSISSLIESDTIWFGTSTKGGDSTSTVPGFLPDTTIFWWRGAQTHNLPTIEIQVEGDSAWVSWARNNFGYIYSLAKVDTLPLELWSKKLSETAQIRATFFREGSTGDDNRGWKLHTISLAYGKSDTVNTVRIDSVRIKSSRYPDYLIRDPLNTYFSLDSLVAFKPGEPVTLTLYTNVTNGHAFLHTFILIWPFYVRVPFTYMGNGVYEGTWNAQLVAVPRFAIFDIMPHSTLYTPDQPYDFNGWLLPYMIRQ